MNAFISMMSVKCSILSLTILVLVVPAKFQSPSIYSLHIRTDVQYRFATTLVTSRVANPANYTQETVFNVFLPEEAFISNFTLEIDGQIYPGIVKDKGEAKKDYERAKKRGQTAGLVSQKPRESRKFNVKISVAAFSKSTFNLTYQELLKRVKGAYEHKIFINPGYPVKDFKVTVAILESRDITKLVVPPIKALKHLLTENEEVKENALAVITRPTSRSAIIQYSPTLDDQGTDGVSGQFIVQYDIDRSLDGGDILVVNGYFVHFLAPEVKTVIPKDVLFILDVSGSMGGRKIEQLKDAMFIVLDELKEGDRFNIITFSQSAKTYKPGMIDVTQREVLDAKTFTKGMTYGGSTNINEAVLKGLELLRNSRQEDERSPVIVFLTDGRPTTGRETNPNSILRNIDVGNEGEVPIFSLAFGKDADWNLMKSMSIRNDGIARKIYEDSDSDLQISGFYDEIAVTLLNNVTVKYIGDTVDPSSLTKSEFKNYFEGSELVVAGKLTDPGAPTFDLQILSNSLDGTLVLNVDKDSNYIDVSETESLMELTDFQEITEKTWAYLTIKQLLYRADGEIDDTVKEALQNRAKDLSLQYGFVTPLTSMVVTKPEVEPIPTEPPHVEDLKPDRSALRLRGPFGVIKNNPKMSADNDPHFIINIKGLDNAVCFDVMGNEGDVYTLVNDKYSGLAIDAKVVANKMIKTTTKYEFKSGDIKTYLGEITIKRWRSELLVTPTNITFTGETVHWMNGTFLNLGTAIIVFNKDGSELMVKFEDRITIVIMRHLKSRSLLRAGKVNFLGIYIVEHQGLSYHTHGILGQFLHRKVVLKKTKSHQGKLMGQLRVSGNTQKPRRLMATLGSRLNPASNATVRCWMVQHNGGALLDGNISDYLVQ
ncbi:inter-alpha-trypsin inhibitor heavy chain H3-like isoform X2 [Ruditapes philippinarum]|uniref:inter-alpha-trypsin inhibitor heavy chain H3-like isoform X2 n=1 Tax=Ruditapes philippinarum TaxID=129788 RepID=UPI00295B0EEF|nr:inter-alpha-trypsin inhibitor heavy chain H3-like isoform X2 [Ruditapes philippinarum]